MVPVDGCRSALYTCICRVAVVSIAHVGLMFGHVVSKVRHCSLVESLHLCVGLWMVCARRQRQLLDGQTDSIWCKRTWTQTALRYRSEST